ncbi:type II toxin-antitoxin system VapC family toxin [Candidatus Woesearchaeota archaeon]|nr:type II toxin-antitoxin system VapC family toxin [Candidatus Woesearchaeota archaeon]
MTKFIDANIFIERWNNPRVRELIDNLRREEYCTSVLVLTEVYHKLKKKNVKNAFEYVRNIMGVIKVYDIITDDLFNAIKSTLEININDKIHIATMKRNGLSIIISYDTDFDRDKTITREEP